MNSAHQSKVQKLMNNALDWWVYGSFHMAFCVFAFTLFTYRVFRIFPNYYYLLFVANSTYLVYSCHRLLGINRVGEAASLKRFRIVKEHTKHIIIYVLISLFVEIILVFKLPWNALYLLSLAAITTILYISPILPKGKRLRDFWYIKIFLIAGAFGLVCAYIPLHLENILSTESIKFSFIQAAFVFGLTIPFDVRDIEVDSIDGNMTLATYLGRRKALALSVISLMVIAVYLGLFWDWKTALPLMITASVTIMIIYRLNTKLQVNDFYYTFWLDGMLILPWLIYTIGQIN
jgi:1,4-dihydroxy-2-naphthoate octaprenyltransferase